MTSQGCGLAGCDFQVKESPGGDVIINCALHSSAKEQPRSEPASQDLLQWKQLRIWVGKGQMSFHGGKDRVGEEVLWAGTSGDVKDKGSEQSSDCSFFVVSQFLFWWKCRCPLQWSLLLFLFCKFLVLFSFLVLLFFKNWGCFKAPDVHKKNPICKCYCPIFCGGSGFVVCF